MESVVTGVVVRLQIINTSISRRISVAVVTLATVHSDCGMKFSNSIFIKIFKVTEHNSPYGGIYQLLDIKIQRGH